MNESKLRALARLLRITHADIGDALEPFFDEKNANAIVQAGRRFFDELDELESVVTVELGKLAQAERANDAAMRDETGRTEHDWRAVGAGFAIVERLCPECGELTTPARIPGRGALCVKCGEVFNRLAVKP